ncbi:MAG: DUF5777 family beta-barrel protein [Bacteroidetes bacterium]|nr:DUF5777 family beta-barrel protein [Bacteroidota bacterium]
MLKRYLVALALLPSLLIAQDDLLSELEGDAGQETDYAFATWKGTKVVNLQTNELPGAGVLQYTILHRFGSFSEDFMYNFLGLNNAQVRLTLDYSPTEWLNLGLGHTGFQKTYDGFVKYRLLRQSKGAINMPVSVTGFSSAYYSALRYDEQDFERNLGRRMSYVHELIIARKFNQNFSAQVVPTVIHTNLSQTFEDANTQIAIGLAARYKITAMHAITVEWVPILNGNSYIDPEAADGFSPYNNALSIGMDIETGGHVFQLFITNARGVAEPYAFTQTPGSWLEGDLHFGFNISRVFTMTH